MVTPIETLRANMAHLDNMARAYADAMVAHWQAGDGAKREAFDALLAAHEHLNRAAQVVAETL